MRLSVLIALLAVTACDSAEPVDRHEPDPSDPTGAFVVEPIWFRLSRVAAPEVGGVEDLQAWIDGELDVVRSGDALTASGTCTLRRRRHRAWIPETSDDTETRSFTASGTISGSDVVLTFQGCAWAMDRYQGTFAEGTYDLRLADPTRGPVWNPDIWSVSTQLAGDDPRELTLARD